MFATLAPVLAFADLEATCSISQFHSDRLFSHLAPHAMLNLKHVTVIL